MTRFQSLVTRSFVTFLVGSAALAVNLHAQDESVTVSIPDPFTVGTQEMMPGTYQFSLQSSQFLLSVTNVRTGDEELFDVRPEQQRIVEQRGHLIFRNSAGRTVLNEIHYPGTNTFSELIQPHPGARFERARSSRGKTACVAQR